MNMLSMKLAMPLLAITIWLFSSHTTIFSDAAKQYLHLSSYEAFTGRSIATTDINLNSDALNLLETVTVKQINESVEFASNIIGFMKRLEDNLMWSNIKVTDGTPSQGMQISFAPEPAALTRGVAALIALRASNQLMNIYCDRLSNVNSKTLTYRDCARILSRFTYDNTALDSDCKALRTPCKEEENNSPYRKINGSCNNIEHAHHGESFTGYVRLLYAMYADGIYEPRRSVTKKPLPNPRHIVSSLVKYGNKPSKLHTLALMQWTQFVEHDLSRSATATSIYTTNPIECCSREGENLSPRFIHPFCAPIYVADDKSYSEQGVHCLNFVRSIAAMRSDCSVGAADQVNQATHYLDGSQIYGSTDLKYSKLRAFKDGKLLTSTFEGRTFLPLSKNPKHDCQSDSNNTICYTSGDTRVNFLPQLALMHTLWYREHNRIATELHNINDHWDDEKLFHETRRIVIAEIQRITFHEWLPILTGKKHQEKILIHSTYDKKIDASITNSFATAVMRSFKSLSDGKPKLFDENRVSHKSLMMRDYFNNPSELQVHGTFDELLRGLATQPSQKLDVYFAEDLINQLYTNGHFGFDVLSFDVQRGREHGLPSYNEFRTFCGLTNAKTFIDFSDALDEKDISQLSKIYSSPDDVDLIIGGLLEKAIKGSLLGPTFLCIATDQILRIRKGDRYFYDNPHQPHPFSNQQLEQINKVSLARIFCDNGDNIKKMQPQVLELISPRNPLIRCNSHEIPSLDLSYWKERESNVIRT